MRDMHFILNFHGIGEIRRPYEDNEEPYWISQSFFCEILDLVQRQSVPIGISFDDGNESDFYIGVPELQKRGLEANFFALAGKLGQTGYLTEAQILSIDANPLFNIGSHGMDHLYWPGLDEIELTREISVSREILGALCNREIIHAGLPFGGYNRHILKTLLNHGYSQVFSSDGGQRLSNNNPIPRFSVRNDTTLRSLANKLKEESGILKRAKNELRARVKALK